MPAAGGAPAEITRKGIRLPVASRDGKYIYFARGGNLFAKLWRIPVDGGDEELLLPSIQSFKFVPTADGVYSIVAQTAPLPNQIRFHSWTTGQDSVVATLPFTATAAGLDLSPDGKTLLFAPWEQTEGDLMSVQLKPPQ